MRSSILLFVGLASAACGRKDSAVTQVVTPPDTVATTTTIVFPGATATAKIAATVGARDTGLMNVTSLAANSGMLFVWAEVHDSLTTGTFGGIAFYMLDTPIPLSIAFIDSTMTVVNVDEMAAETLTLHKPVKPVKFALEMNQGWFTAHGIAAGARASFTIPAGTVIDP